MILAYWYVILSYAYKSLICDVSTKQIYSGVSIFFVKNPKIGDSYTKFPASMGEKE